MTVRRELIVRREDDLEPREANFVPLSPLDFLSRAGDVYPEKVAVVSGNRAITYRAFRDRAARLAGALRAHGIGAGDTVSVLAPNTPEVLEAHFGVPLADAVLNTINTRLDAPAIAFIMAHAETSLLIVHTALLPLARNALERLGGRIRVVVIEGSAEERAALGASNYEAFLADADPADWAGPADEWQSIALNYTSGTTGNPKGVGARARDRRRQVPARRP